jgi:signal transduction histidine kinase/ActR/RegA family two-component response regulator
MPDPAPTAPASATSAASQHLPRSREHPIEVKARMELVRLAYRELQGGTLASIAIVAAFAIAVGLEAPSTQLWAWLGFMLAVLGYRLWLGAAFNRKEPPQAQFPRWGFRYIVGTTLTALGWGTSVWLLPSFARNTTLGVVHVLMLAGVTTGAARLLLPMRKGSVAYLFAVMVPLALRFLAYGDVPGIMVGLCAIVFMWYMTGATLRYHRTLSDALVMRFERETLAAELHAQNVQREMREVELREAHERAEAASRAKADFLATISHEIRTPMNGVLGMLRIVRDTTLAPDQREYLKTATDSAETLLLLLNDVLDFSKIEAGRLELQAGPFAPANTAGAVADLMHARARDKGLQFELQVGDNIPSAVISDSNRLRQILINLIGNAIKFTDRGRVELNVTCPERTDTTAVMHFTVTDTGIGIDSAALERLFKPFTQADNSMSRRYGGTGLGLAISVRLAQAMGGLLQVKSTLNQGTTFRLILPCKLPETVAPGQREDSRFVTPQLRGRVLVVEDDAVNRQVLELFLRKMGVAPKFAVDGEGAIKIAASETFDVVLMDCQLPGIDGLETTRRIRRKLEGGRPLKIIALTANTGRNIRDSCLAAGMDDFLTKPVRLEYLVDVLKRNLPGG